MSWRIVVDGYQSKDGTSGNYPWADAVVVATDTNEAIKAVAQKWAWQRPLKIYTPDVQDSAFLRLVLALQEEGLEPENDFRAFTSKYVEIEEQWNRVKAVATETDRR